MFKVLMQGTRVICGDTFMIQICNFSILPENFEISGEVFEITLHKLFPEQTRIPNVMLFTHDLGELIAYDDPIHYYNGYNTMKIRLRIDISQPLQFGTVAPNDKNSINMIDFVYQELPRLFCNFCHRLGHLREDCIELFLINHQEILSPSLPQDLPHPIQQVIGPFIDPEYDDANYQEMYHNVDIEDPDPGSDWSTDWDINPFDSHASSGEDNSVISFLDSEGYKQDGFHSDTSTDSERTISAAWIVEENSNFMENQGFEQVIVSPDQATEVQQPFSPFVFLVSDIE